MTKLRLPSSEEMLCAKRNYYKTRRNSKIKENSDVNQSNEVKKKKLSQIQS